MGTRSRSSRPLPRWKPVACEVWAIRAAMAITIVIATHPPGIRLACTTAVQQYSKILCNICCYSDCSSTWKGRALSARLLTWKTCGHELLTMWLFYYVCTYRNMQAISVPHPRWDAIYDKPRAWAGGRFCTAAVVKHTQPNQFHVVICDACIYI